MALFGKADADVPILTRFYQVDAANAEKSVLAGGELYLFLLAENGISNNDNPNDPFGPVQPDQLNIKFYSYLWSLLTYLLDSFADDQWVPGEFIDKLMPILQSRHQYHLFFPINSHGFGQGQRNDEAIFEPYPSNYLPSTTMFPIRQAFLTTSGQRVEQPKERIITELIELLAGPRKEFDRVRRCQECNNPFIMLKRGQKFCSHRCRNRVSQRKRDNKKRLSVLD